MNERKNVIRKEEEREREREMKMEKYLRPKKG